VSTAGPSGRSPGDQGMLAALGGVAAADVTSASSGGVVSGRGLRSRLRAGSRSRRTPRRFSDVYVWVLAAALFGAIAAESLRPLVRELAGPGWAVPGAPTRLFVVAAVMLLLGGLARVLGLAGPVTASSAFRFWLLATPLRRIVLLRRRVLALTAALALLASIAAVLIAHAASVAVLPVAAVAALAAMTVTAAAISGQASDEVERAVHLIGRTLSAVSILGFSSLATGVGRASADSLLRLPPAAGTALIAVLAATALGTTWRAYRALDRIDISVLSRGQGLWNAGSAAAASLDVFLLTDFLAEQRARLAGRVRSAEMGSSFAVAAPRSELVRARRRPYLAIRGAAAAIIWWGCRPVLPPAALSVAALVIGFLLVLPLSGTLKQLAASPGLRAHFVPRDRWLTAASVSACLLAATIWTAIVLPGMPLAGHPGLGIIIVLGITVAVWRTVTRPPLDYSKPPVPTPFGDLPLDLWRQLARGPLVLGVVIAVVLLAGRR
jgi:hypothetical protein